MQWKCLMKNGSGYWRRSTIAGKAEKILVVGSGAMACLFSARLCAAGIPVAILGSWPEGLQALRQKGVRLVASNGEEQSYPVEVVKYPAPFTGSSKAIVLVKSWQTERAARQLDQYLAPGGLALTLQNGLGNQEKLAYVLGAERVALGSTTVGATLLGPGRVRPAGEGLVTLGEHAHIESLAGVLRSAGFAVEIIPDPISLLWGKLVINTAINPLTAILRVANGVLLDRPSANELMVSAARETAAVANAQGISLPYLEPGSAVEAVARRTASNQSSMLQDVLRHAPTEIDAICGAVVLAGEKWNIPTPVNRVLWKMVKAIEET
jgi:2-dehydropantoate 2-reductase